MVHFGALNYLQVERLELDRLQSLSDYVLFSTADRLVRIWRWQLPSHRVPLCWHDHQCSEHSKR